MGRLSGKQILLIVAQKNYNEEEYSYLDNLFIEEGAVVAVASHSMDKALGRLDGYVVPHLTIADAETKNYDAIVLIGGYGAYTSLWDDADLHRILKEANSGHKLIAAASVSPVALANADLLQGKKATVYPDYNAAVILQQKGAVHVHDKVVVDDNIITSNQPRWINEFAEMIISKLTEGR
jgi:protease I